MRAFLAVVTVSLFALPAFAQQQQPVAGETIEVNIVNVEAVVTDRSGNPVRGLSAADFEVKDNGVVQSITNFSEFADDGEQLPAGRQMQAGIPSDAAGPAQREPRNVLLFIERTTMPPYHVKNFFDQIRSMLHETIEPGDRAAIVSWFYANKVEQDFTSDLPKLDAALDRIQERYVHVGVDPESELIFRQYLQDQLAEVQELRAATGAATDTAGSMMFDGYDQARAALTDIRRKTIALNTMIDTMAGASGRRIVLMVTKRYSQYAGAEFFGGMVPAKYEHELNTLPERESLVNHANAAGVALYTLYPTGPVSTQAAKVEQGPRRQIYKVDPQADAMANGRENLILVNETAPLTQIAKATGGLSGWGPTDINKLARSIKNDATSYYSLGFRAKGDDAGKAHNVTVSVKRKGMTVRSRRQYFIKDEQMKMKDTVLAALYKGQVRMKVPFEVGVGAPAKKGRRRTIPVTLHIPLAGLTALPAASGRAGAFRVYGATGGLLGAMSDVFEKRQEFTIAAGDDVSSKYLTYNFDLVADGNADRVAVAVFDENSHESGVIRIPLKKD